MALRRPYLCSLVLVCVCLLGALQCATAWPVVRKGNTGANVVVVQDLLPNLVNCSGIFDNKTEAAVKSLQGSCKLPATGIVDAVTWPRMAHTITYGSGKAAHAIQYLLVYRYKLLNATQITSVYSATTRAAVKKFQANYGLPQTGDCDPRTWETLVSNTALKPSSSKPQPCSGVKRSRAGIVALAKSTVGKTMTYTQKSSWYIWHGITHKTCPNNLPQYGDAYSFVAWLFWTAYGNGPDFVRNCNWGTCSAKVMTNKTGRQVSFAQAKPGDVVIFSNGSPWPHMHAALYVGNKQVVTMGYYYQDRMWPRTVLLRNIDWWKQNGHYLKGYTFRRYDQVV